MFANVTQADRRTSVTDNQVALGLFYKGLVPHVPGDVLGISSIVYRESPETLCALSDCVVCPFDRQAFSELTVQHPRLSALILVLCQLERDQKSVV